MFFKQQFMFLSFFFTDENHKTCHKSIVKLSKIGYSGKNELIFVSIIHCRQQATKTYFVIVVQSVICFGQSMTQRKRGWFGFVIE